MPTTRSLTVVLMAAVSLILVVPAVLSQDGASRGYLPVGVNNGEPAQQTPEPTWEPTPLATPSLPPATVPAPVPTPTEPAAKSELPPLQYPLADVTITLERTPCFGACPDYTLTIHGDGRVVYEGRRFVQEVGRREDQIARDTVAKLLDRFYEVRFFGFEPEYVDALSVEVDDAGVVHTHRYQVTDLPTYIVTFEVGAFRKRVVDYWQAPQNLRELEIDIDTAADVARWVGRRP